MLITESGLMKRDIEIEILVDEIIKLTTAIIKSSVLNIKH